MSEAATDTPPEKSPAAGLVDFSDKLSPMLVKELRQGMRTNLFTVAFILLQAFMILCMLIGLGGSSDDTSGFFWFFVTTALLVVQPIRGFGALSGEFSLNTMDLIQLTQLGSWRITFGKWAAIVAQSLLLLTGILPYVVMRYFQGGVNLFDDLLMIFYIMIGSMLLTAMTVGFSSFKSVILRVALLIGGGIGAMSIIGGGFTFRMASSMGMGSAPKSYVWEIVGGILAAAYATYYLLDLGASRIAPESANHSSRKRLISLLFIVIILCLPWFGVEKAFCFVITAIVALLVGVDSLTESPAVLPGVLRPFSKNGITKLCANFLTPGWHTGIGFFAICCIVYVAGLYMHLDASDFQEFQGWIVFTSAIAAITFPLLLIHLFFFPVTYSQFYFGLYVLIQVCVLAIGWFVAVVASATFGHSLDPLLYMCIPVPFVNMLAVTVGDNEDIYFFIASLVFLFFSLLVPMVRAAPIFKRMRQTFKAIQDGTSDDIVEQSERQVIPKGAE